MTSLEICNALMTKVEQQYIVAAAFECLRQDFISAEYNRTMGGYGGEHRHLNRVARELPDKW